MNNAAQMTAQEIKELIATELSVEPDIRNVWGVDMTQCLIEPRKQQYKANNDAIETYELWTVLEESGGKNGYKIFYDEEVNQFGLALQSDTDALIDIGYYGSFLKTVYSL